MSPIDGIPAAVPATAGERLPARATGGAAPRGITALSCAGVSLAFPVFDEGGAWRLVLRGDLAGRRVQVLDDVALSVPKGAFVGILGYNGAGKSTLLRVLAGVYHSTPGTVLRNGRVTGLFEPGWAGKPFLTAREYAKRSLQLQGVPRACVTELLDEIREFSELGVDFERPLYMLSSGMVARLYFAATTAVPYDVYLIDEFLAVGDEHFQNKCWRRMRERLSQGASGIVVTHDWTKILRLCEEAHLMAGGRIIESGPSEEIVRAYLNQAGEGRTEVAAFCPDNPTSYTARCGEDAAFCFGIQLGEAVSVVLGYSIELLRAGAAWEILLMGEELPVADAIGRHEVKLRIPHLPLAPGRYYLNLFLKTRPRERARERSVVCDVRSWTHGNALALTVEGPVCPTVTAVPLSWIREGALP